MNKKGFTLIELLAVIIILGILMIIAIPSVTKYISDSRKNAYVDTAKEIVGGARNIVNGGKLEMYATDTTYYIPVSCIKTENASKSPYGDFTEAYIGVIYDGKGYKYYWISVDDAGQGVSKITPLDKLDTDSIESDLKGEDIKNTVETTGIGNRTEIKILNCSNNNWDGQYHLDNISNNVSEENGGGSSSSGSGSGNTNPVCIPATTLHTAECNAVATGCSEAGYKDNNHIITYGTIVSGNPKPGDAYDCDVNNDGMYNEQLERFYYLGVNGTNPILIFYKNINDQVTYAYDTSNENWHGPRTAYQYLPSTSEWDHPDIIAPGTRQIVDLNGNSNTSGGTIESFTYTGKAARFLTTNEVLNACSSLSTVGSSTVGELDGCVWLLEKIGRFENYANESAGAYGYWLENPRSVTSDGIYNIYGNKRRVYDNSSSADTLMGVRPVITIKSSGLG